MKSQFSNQRTVLLEDCSKAISDLLADPNIINKESKEILHKHLTRIRTHQENHIDQLAGWVDALLEDEVNN